MRPISNCSPAAAINDDGTFRLGAVTATASFRFTKWIGEWMAKSGAKLIIGKGGMSAKDYKEHFVPNGAIYLTTVGYGTGAICWGRGVKRVKAVHWNKELGLAQAMWGAGGREHGAVHRRRAIWPATRCSSAKNAKDFGPISPRSIEGTVPAVLKRFGEDRRPFPTK